MIGFWIFIGLVGTLVPPSTSKLHTSIATRSLEPPESISKTRLTAKLRETFKQHAYFPSNDNLNEKLLPITPLIAKSAPSPEQFSTFDKWLEDANFSHKGLKIMQVNDSYRKIIATESIPRNKNLFTIGEKHMLLSSIANVWFNKHSPTNVVNEHARLALYMVRLLNLRDKEWTPYLDILPSSFPGNPLFASPKELEVLRGSWTHSLIHSKLYYYKKDYEMLLKIENLLSKELGSTTPVSYSDFLWARTIIQTRSFTVNVQGSSRTALIPMADMLNHRRPPMVEWFSDSDSRFIMRTLREIEAGEDVWNNYGNKEIFKFFINYGFVPEYRPESALTAVVRIRINPSDMHKEMKARRIRSDGQIKSQRVQILEDNQWYVISISRSFNHLRMKAVVALVAFILCQDVEIEYISFSASFVSAHLPRTLEIRTWQFLKYWSEERLQQFPTSLEEDQVLIAAEEKGTFMYYMRTLLIEEKRTYQALVDEADKKLELLEPNNNYIEWPEGKDKNSFWKSIQIGHVLDARDYLGYWYTAMVLSISGSTAFIHFDDFSEIYDEWIPLSGSRLAPFRTFSKGGKFEGGVLDPALV